MAGEQQKTAVHILLQEHKQTIAALQPSAQAHDYIELKNNCVINELNEEIAKLEQMLARDDFAQAFKERCRQRAQSHANTALSFAAQPAGSTNELYWKIAKIISKPQTLAEMLRIILPDVITCVSVSQQEPDSAPANRQKLLDMIENADVLISDETVDQLMEPCGDSPQQLGNYVICGQYIMPVRQISKFMPTAHRKCYHQLHHSHQALAKKLYQHNLILRDIERY